MTDSTYTPVSYEFRGVIQEQIEKRTHGKIFFWGGHETVDELAGRIAQLAEIAGEGTFIVLDNNERVRIDKIITLFGKPGAAYDEYDSYANQCLSCTAGVPL